MFKKLISLVLILITFSFLGTTFISRQNKATAAVPTGFEKTEIITSGLVQPTAIEFAPDGRLFILEYDGTVRIYKNGQLLAQPFVKLPAWPNGDLGLIGVAFDPEFTTNKWVYFYYVDEIDKFNKIVRFNATGDTATDGPVKIFSTNYQAAFLHGGGSLNFGPDGKLYAQIGDNGYPQGAQNIQSTHGKILRMNKDGSAPTDNPFFGRPDSAPLVWAYGLRNPFRGQFDSVTGKYYVGDVGNERWEEINLIEKGKNYGWPVCEGACNNAAYTDPFYTYSRIGDGGAVVGGPTYRKSMFPAEYQGNLFFADFVKYFIKRLKLDANGNVVSVHDFDLAAGAVVDLKVASDGALWYLTFSPGPKLVRVSYGATNKSPIAKATADKTSGATPLTVNFSSTGSSDPEGRPLTYEWFFGDGTRSTSANPTKIYSNVGSYDVVLKVSDGVNTTQDTSIKIQAGIAPTVQIVQPPAGQTYKAGDTFNYSITAKDSQNQAIDGSKISTEVRFHHDDHVHPFYGPVTGNTGTFTIPTIGEVDSNVYYKMSVTATDVNGLKTTTERDILPLKSNFTLRTEPVGLKVLLDGTPTDTPKTINSVVNIKRELNVPASQTLNGKTYVFDRWSDNGAQQHFINVPATDTTYTAYFKEATTPTTAYNGEYFNNITLSGTPVLTRNDAAINFNWQGGSPATGVNADRFSARWTKVDNLAAGKYRFTATVDNGVRIKVDGVTILDKFQDLPQATYTVDTDLTAGNHTIVVEYLEIYGWATARVNYARIGDSVTPTPTATPTATPTPTTNPTPNPTGATSNIKVYAAGTVSNGVYPNLTLKINDAAVATFTNVQGNPSTRQFVEYTYNHNGTVRPEQVKVEFTNDANINGQDRNVRIDKIVINGISYESEADTTYSVGSWNAATGCAAGNKKSEWLNCNGYFQYVTQAGTPTPTPTVATTSIKLIAEGTVCDSRYPDMQILVNDAVVKTFTGVTAGLKEYEYVHPSVINLSQVKVQFPNDCNLNGQDRNLRVDKIFFNGTAYESEAPGTYSLGSWSADVGCNGGYKSSEVISCGGYFKYN